MINPENISIVPNFFKVVHAQILRKYLRRSCGSFWSGLELRRPTLDRFRSNFPIFVRDKVRPFIVFPFFCYQAGSLATQDPSQTKDLSVLIYSVVLKH